MLISTQQATEPHFVLGPIFALTEINSGFLSDLKNPQQAFASLIPALTVEAEKVNAHAVIGAQFSFVDSNITSMVGRLMGGTNNQKVFVFGYGTAIQLSRYLQEAEQQKQDEHYRSSQTNGFAQSLSAYIDTATSDPTAGLQKLNYKTIEYYLLPNGQLRYRTPKGWLDFRNLEQLKQYKGVK